MEIIAEETISILSKIINESIPIRYFQALMIAMAFDILTGVFLSIKMRRFSSKIGTEGLIKKTTIFAACMFVGVLEYLLWQENLIIKTFLFIAIAYETSSIFENIDAIDPRFGKAVRTIWKSIVDRMEKTNANKEVDESRGNRG